LNNVSSYEPLEKSFLRRLAFHHSWFVLVDDGDMTTTQIFVCLSKSCCGIKFTEIILCEEISIFSNFHYWMQGCASYMYAQYWKRSIQGLLLSCLFGVKTGQYTMMHNVVKVYEMVPRSNCCLMPIPQIISHIMARTS
jgi:hypothetical protein